ncbi:unnamed protein product [Cuscuta europaea]|uniref:Uncharacterized protein n=1 Tax=Cuscuta europaea TaxID=41803 RepID=A0A9P0ZCT5_CUSEU|nr:unnamed protein product [Cuscuta europaea]
MSFSGASFSDPSSQLLISVEEPVSIEANDLYALPYKSIKPLVFPTALFVCHFAGQVWKELHWSIPAAEGDTFLHWVDMFFSSRKEESCCNFLIALWGFDMLETRKFGSNSKKKLFVYIDFFLNFCKQCKSL